MKEIPLASTFHDDERIEVEILSPPSSTGLCKVKNGDKILVRNKVQLTPLNNAAKEMLK